MYLHPLSVHVIAGISEQAYVMHASEPEYQYYKIHLTYQSCLLLTVGLLRVALYCRGQNYTCTYTITHYHFKQGFSKLFLLYGLTIRLQC